MVGVNKGKLQYGTNHLKLKQSTYVTHVLSSYHTRVPFMAWMAV